MKMTVQQLCAHVLSGILIRSNYNIYLLKSWSDLDNNLHVSNFSTEMLTLFIYSKIDIIDLSSSFLFPSFKFKEILDVSIALFKSMLNTGAFK